MTAATIGQYEKALELLAEIDSSHGHEKRQIEVKALDGMGRHEELIQLLDPPRSADEVVRATSLLLDARRFDEATARLNAASALIPHSLFEDLAATIAARRMTS